MSQKPRYTPSTLLDDVNFDYSQQAEAALKGVRELRKVVDRDRDITESDPSSSSYRNSLFAFAFPEEWKWSSNEIFTIHPFVECFGACWDFFSEEVRPFLIRVAEQELEAVLLEEIAPELMRRADLERKYEYLTLRRSYEGMVEKITSAFTMQLGTQDRELQSTDGKEDFKKVYANDPRFRELKNMIQIETEPVTYHPSQWRYTFLKRYRHGILRDGQIRLILAVVYATIEQIKGLLAIPLDQLPQTSMMVWRGKDGDLKYHSALATLILEAATICKRNSVFIESLLAHPEFRSERLETLLLNHLLEDDVNLELTRELAARDRMFLASWLGEFFGSLGLPAASVERELVVIDRS